MTASAMTACAADRVAARTEELAELGLVIEAFGPGAIVVREVPALLGDVDVQGLMTDVSPIKKARTDTEVNRE